MKTYVVPEHVVTEVEAEDWDALEYMTVKEAVDFLDNECDDLEDYAGGYNYRSSDPDQYHHAKMLRAYGKVLAFARNSCYKK